MGRSRTGIYGFNERRITSWTLTTPDRERVEWVVSIKLADRWGTSRKVKFVAVGKPRNVPTPTTLENDDFFKLREDCETATAGFVDLAWTPTIYIKVTGSSDRDESEQSEFLQMEIKFIEIAVDRDKRQYVRDQADKRVWHRNDPIVVGVGERGDMVSLIPDTIDNRAKLAMILDGLDKIRGALTNYMAPKNIKKSLAAVTSGRPLLGFQ